MKNPGLEWWTSIAAEILDGKPLSVAKELAKLPKLLKGDTPTEERPEDVKVLAHTNDVLEKVYNPLPIEPDLNLWDIYITPAVEFFHSSNEEEKETATDLLRALLDTMRKSTDPIVLLGNPGHGKSSSMRMLTQIQALDPSDSADTLLFYEFKNLGDLNAVVFQTLQRITPFVKEESFFYGRQSVLLLDGMDERQIGNNTDSQLGNFIRDIFMLAKQVNKRGDSRLNVIFTGRTLFVDQIKRYFIADHHRFEIEDFNDDQIDSWLNKYNNLKNNMQPITRKALVDKHLEKLIKQPILLTIVSRILADPLGISMLEKVSKEEITRGCIYKVIVSWTYQRKHDEDRAISALPDEETYTRFLQIVAFLMFRNGGETIPIKELAEKLEDKDTRKIFQLGSLFSGKSDFMKTIKDLAVGFYFEGLNDDAFAFIHKSIRDYLTVEAIHTLLNEALDGFNHKRVESSCDRAANDIYYILGKSTLSHEDHLPFLQDLMGREGDQDLQPKLRAFFDLAKTHCFLTKHEGGQNEDPLVTETNVLGALSYWVEQPQDVGPLIRLMGATNLAFVFSLQGADLQGADLQGAYLKDANLQGADLQGANLQGANLKDANLQNAHLPGADLYDADLQDANLQDANLQRANLFSAGLQDADLPGACLHGTDLEDASLFSANLQNTDLHGADLEGSNLQNTNLKDADLQDANLHGVHWKGIEKIVGCNIHKVRNPPDGFKKWALSKGAVDLTPEHW